VTTRVERKDVKKTIFKREIDDCIIRHGRCDNAEKYSRVDVLQEKNLSKKDDAAKTAPIMQCFVPLYRLPTRRMTNNVLGHVQVKGNCIAVMEHLRSVTYGITQCYLLPNTSERTPPLPQPVRPVLNLPTPEG